MNTPGRQVVHIAPDAHERAKRGAKLASRLSGKKVTMKDFVESLIREAVNAKADEARR